MITPEKELDSYRFWFSILLIITIFLPIVIIQHYQKNEYRMVLEEIEYWKGIQLTYQNKLDTERNKNYRLRASVISLRRSLDRKRRSTSQPTPRNDPG